ncbi:helix-turn-helix domain-containing protein [Desulfosporosinus sp.]|uniref:helix-turn-helix domain-containing protein n=1 Tax=Desulfosporosinus sp. TaxID=157907 RepID=UPI00345BDEDB|nr:helix-turn-helix transcriptional regulator [Desulfosporosinus sp.]MBC2726230.1 helix-turn-helix transcriptional regulator [Desulfosporosinus sp.]
MQFTLRATRISQGYSVDEVATICDVSPETITNYEKHPSKLPLYLIILLADLYKVSPNSLIANT